MLALLAGMSGCGARGEAVERLDPAPLPSIILITLDTVRADHLHCYGYARATSTQIDAFADSATRYTQAMSTAPWTVPAHASMFTGMAPFRHGAHSFRIEELSENVYPLAEERLTLAEALAAEGYFTGAFVSNTAFLHPHWNLGQGFQTYKAERLRAEALNKLVFGYLDLVENDRFFLFINYMDAHRPYNAAPRPEVVDPPPPNDQGQLLNQLIAATMLNPSEPPPTELRQKVIDQYDTAIANLDTQVGALFDELRRRKLFDDCLIIVTSDHGEYFGEHALVEHSKDVYQPALHVPLIIKRPKQTQGAVDEAMISLMDLPFLIAREMPAGAREKLAARFPVQPGQHPIIAENYYARSHDVLNPNWGKRFDRVRAALLAWPYKVIWSSNGPAELYNLGNDPGELHDIAASRPDLTRRLVEQLVEYRTRGKAPMQRTVLPEASEDLREQLRSLGYAGEDQ